MNDVGAAQRGRPMTAAMMAAAMMAADQRIWATTVGAAQRGRPMTAAMMAVAMMTAAMMTAAMMAVAMMAARDDGRDDGRPTYMGDHVYGRPRIWATTLGRPYRGRPMTVAAR